ncbi:hypothetical protein ACN28S_07140 [Cystobacter fuscus]
MRLEDGAADGQAHAQPLALGGEEGLEEAREHLLGQPHPGVLHHQLHRPSRCWVRTHTRRCPTGLWLTASRALVAG